MIGFRRFLLEVSLLSYALHRVRLPLQEPKNDTLQYQLERPCLDSQFRPKEEAEAA